MRRALTLLFALAVALPMIGPVAGSDRARAATELVVDLSAPVVKVTTGFDGTDLLLYGAKEGPGNVVVVIRGPARDETVRKKARVGGIWVNRESIALKAVPSFYWVASNHLNLDQTLSREQREIYQIGVDVLDFDAPEDADPTDVHRFTQAVKRIRRDDGLYSAKTEDLIFLSDALFRTRVSFPANVAVGSYGVDVFLVRKGEIVATETKILNVRKFGIEAWVYDFAHRYSFLYGIAAIIIALVAGWAANAAFRKA